MAAKQTLTLASMWAFEDIGVEEIQNEFKKVSPGQDYLCEYSKIDDVLVIKGNFEGSSSKSASVVSDFIEEQKNKDLLDMPRIRQLDISSVFDGHEDQNETASEKEPRQGLLNLVDDSNDEVIPVYPSRVAKSWLSQNGDLGCFASFQEILGDIAAMTDTEVSVIDELRGIQVSGQNQADVKNALAKLTRIEKSLSFIQNPRVANMIIAPRNERSRVRIQNYSDLNPVALRRILTDPNSYSNSLLNQTFATVLLYFDPDIQLFTPPETLVSPPKVSNEPAKSRIWNDFTFQEIGKGDDFINMGSIVEQDSGDPQAMASGIAPPHPYLSVEKATRVNQWVVERVEMENENEQGPEPELEPSSVTAQLKPLVESSPIEPPLKKPPGVKTRKAVSVAQSQPAPVPEPAPEPTRPSSPSKFSTIPRKKWKMQYEPEPEDQLPSLPESAGTTPSVSRPLSESFLLKEPDSSHGSSTTARPHTPENKIPVSVNFDPTKYGRDKPPQHNSKSSGGSSTSPVSVANSAENVQAVPKRKPGRKELIDVLTPVTAGGALSSFAMSFDQPALVPQRPGEREREVTPPRDLTPLDTEQSTGDLLGLDSENEIIASASSNTIDFSMVPLTPVDAKAGSISQEKRLRDLKNSPQQKKRHASGSDESVATTTITPPNRREVSMRLARQKLEELEKHIEMAKKTSDETSTREFHRTMNHKMARPGHKSKGKAEAKAKRQATLEDAWGTIKPAKAKKLPAGSPRKSRSTAISLVKKTEPVESERKDQQSAQQFAEEMEADRKDIENLYESLRPALEAAEYFAGPVTLEVQLGLVLFPLLPKTYNQDLITLEEWNKIFQPRNGLAPPTTKFINRLTSSGSDVDHIVDLKTSEAEGKQHIFEQEYTEYNVSYEFHCRTTADKPFLIAIDEQGKHSIRKPSRTLGAVNLHFPRHTWDASVFLGGIIEHITGSDPELEEAVQYLVDHLWVQPDKSLVRIFSRLPKGNKFVIEKVLMKRWTRHRYIRPGVAAAAATAAATTTTATRSATANTATAPKSLDPDNESSTDSLTNDNDDNNSSSSINNNNNNNNNNNESQGIFLQVQEVQDLLIGSSTSDSQALRARCAPIQEMIKKDRLWYEVSLVSPAIEAILKANANVEIGERTNDWRSIDLLGKDAILFSEEIGHRIPLSPIATAIGNAGLGELLTLTKTVVGKIDGVGYWNCGPGIEAVRVATATAAADAGTVVPGTTASATAGAVAGGGPPTGTVKHPATPSSALAPTPATHIGEQQLQLLEDLDSIREIESMMTKKTATATATATAGGGPAPATPVLEKTAPNMAAPARSAAARKGVSEMGYW